MEKQKSSTKKSVEVLELSRQRQLKEFVQRLSRRVYQEGEERQQQQEGETSSLLLFFIIKWLTAAV